MKKLLIVLSIMSLPIAVKAQFYTISGSYSPTFESYNFGLGVGTNEFFMDFQLGFSDEFFSLGGDLHFPITGNIASGYNLSRIYLGAGAETYLMDDIDREGGFSIYASTAISYNILIFSYGFGYYEYDALVPGEMEYFHRLKLTLALTDIGQR